MQHVNFNCSCSSEDYVVGQLIAFDAQLSEKFTPRGHNKQLPSDSDVVIDEKVIDDAIEFFESLIEEEVNEQEREELKELFGILLSRPVGENNTEEQPLYQDYHTNWEYDQESKEYRNKEIGEILTSTETDLLQLKFMDLFILSLITDTTSMILAEIAIQTWFERVGIKLIRGMSSHYMFGRGGKNLLTTYSIENIKLILQNNKTYLKKFAEEILTGNLSGAQILQRIQMYGEAVTEGYERAKAHSYNVEMPEYPADGMQNCLSKCRCRWILEDDPNDPDYVLGYWKVNPKAEHCKTCLFNQREWNPIRMKKGL